MPHATLAICASLKPGDRIRITSLEYPYQWVGTVVRGLWQFVSHPNSRPRISCVDWTPISYNNKPLYKQEPNKLLGAWIDNENTFEILDV